MKSEKDGLRGGKGSLIRDPPTQTNSLLWT